MNKLKTQILKLKEEKDAYIMSHFYQPMEIQELSDVVGDSFELAKRAMTVGQQLIILCGVRFMAEGAKLLNPEKTVLLPVPDAGCPMADMIGPEDVMALRRRYPEAAVICYVNSSAEVKAYSDVCCTSSSALNIVNALPNRQIIFIPDRNLGSYIAKQLPDKEVILFENGCCPIHDKIREADVLKAKAAHPNARLLVHPECRAEVVKHADHVGSTASILDAVSGTADGEFIIGTENGIVDRLSVIAPGKTVYPLSEDFVCPDMKKISLEDLKNCLEKGSHVIEVPENVFVPARRSLERMIELG